MEQDTFWQIIEAARADVLDPVTYADEVAEGVVERLTDLPLEQIIGFERRFDVLQQQSYRWDLWAAAYLINGGCSDDGFEYFRGWLVAQGRTVWEAALADPDSLADLLTSEVTVDGFECEDMLAVSVTAYEQVTGDARSFWPALLAACGDPADRGGGDPEGETFDFDDDDEMEARLPRLTSLMLEAEDA